MTSENTLTLNGSEAEVLQPPFAFIASSHMKGTLRMVFPEKKSYEKNTVIGLPGEDAGKNCVATHVSAEADKRKNSLATCHLT